MSIGTLFCDKMLFEMAKINVKVIPNAKRERLVEEPGRLKVYLTARAVEGKANAALIDFLAEHFGVKKSSISIVRGLTAREKVVEIDL
jgi:uncharacterized protein (TIGR00251 family)